MSNGKMLAELREMAETEKVPQDVMNRMTMAGLAEIIDIQQDANEAFEQRGECIKDIKDKVEDLSDRMMIAEDARACRVEVDERIERIVEDVKDNPFIRAGRWVAKRPKTSIGIGLGAMILIDVISYKLLPVIAINPNLLAYLESIIR